MSTAVSGGNRHSEMISKLFFRLLPIQILIAVVGAVNGIVSGLFASNFVGKEAMSAVGLYSPINMFIGAVSTLLVGGSQLLSGEYMGKNQVGHTQNVFSLDMVISTVFALLATLLLALAAVTGLGARFATSETVGRIFSQYLLGQSIGVLPMVLGQQISAFLSLEHRMRLTTVASIVFIGVNILLNYIFVGVLQMSAFGLSLASSLGMWVFFLIQFQHYLRSKSMLKLTFRKLQWKDTRSIVRIGIPGAMNSGYQTVRGLIVNALLLHYAGEVSVSAFATTGSLLGLIWAIPGGMLAVSRMLMSISVGEEDRQTLKDEMRIAFARCIPIMLGIAVVIFLLADPFTRMFYRDSAEEVYRMTRAGFRILPFCMPLSIISMHFTCYGQLSNKQVLIHVANIFDGFVSVAIFSLLLVPVIGVNGVYVANILNGVVSAIIFFGYAVAKNRHIPKTMDELMVIPEDFGVPEEERIDISLHELTEVVRISERIQQFCLEKGIDERRAYFAGLSMEEMAGNVISHGYTKDTKRHSVDVRVVHKGDELILRIKDDCVPFDPAERSNIVDPEDVTKNIGIRMTYQLAESISYQNILGLNVLLIRI